MQRSRQDASEGLLLEEREVLILGQLRSRGRVLAAELAAEFQTSEHTIRRHLRSLADAGHCKRVYGGAILIASSEPFALEHMHPATIRNRSLAVAAATIVQSGQLILLDAGTTNIALADVLPNDINLTVATNSPDACARLILRTGFDIILIGGRVNPRGAGSTGSTALLQIKQLKADLCFLGACSFDIAEGVTADDSEQADIKRAMVEASGQVAVAMTSEKLSTSSPFLVASASALDYLIVEANVKIEQLTALQSACFKLISAK